MFPSYFLFFFISPFVFFWKEEHYINTIISIHLGNYVILFAPN